MKITVPAHAEAKIRCTAEFYVFELEGEAQVLLGPNSSTERVFYVSPQPRERVLEIETKGKAFPTLTPLPVPYEQPDPRPVAVPLGFGAPYDPADDIRRLIAAEFALRQRAGEDPDTEEEADDFDIGDDDDLDLNSQYEYQEMDPEEPAEVPDKPGKTDEGEHSVTAPPTDKPAVDPPAEKPMAAQRPST